MANVIAPLFRQLEAIGSSIQTFGTMVFSGRQISGKSITDNLKFLFGQSAQAYTASLDEQDQEVQMRREAREKRAETRRKMTAEAEGEKFKTVAVSASTGDQLARTGGFTAFQSNMDRYFGNVRTQAQDIRDIAKNTKRTADAVQE
jgi:hypothetical protein